MTDPESALVERRRSLVVLVALAVVGLGLLWWLTSRGDDGVASTQDQPSATSQLVAADPLVEPARLPERGTFVDARIQRDGSVKVVQWLRGSSAVSEVELTAHQSDQLTSAPRATGLSVRTSLGKVSLPETTVGTDPVVIDLVRSTLVVRLSYHLSGVALESTSPPGRALIGTVALDAAFQGEEGRSRVQVGGRRILSLACEPQDGGVRDQRPCGEPREGGWSVNLITADLRDHVVAQVDLDQGPARNPDRS